MVKRFNTFIKLQYRMLFKTKSRFISILIITLIGSAFFAGLRISPIVMNATTDFIIMSLRIVYLQDTSYQKADGVP